MPFSPKKYRVSCTRRQHNHTPTELVRLPVFGDNNACTTNSCNDDTGYVYTDVSCGGENKCFTYNCDMETSCQKAPVDYDACTMMALAVLKMDVRIPLFTAMMITCAQMIVSTLLPDVPTLVLIVMIATHARMIPATPSLVVLTRKSLVTIKANDWKKERVWKKNEIGK